MRELAKNPFYVLGLSPDATPMEIEREAQKLLGMMELDFPGVDRYDTPLGPLPRGRSDVRDAAAALRDVRQRLVAELVIRNAPSELRRDGERCRPPVEAPAAVHPGMTAKLGWARGPGAAR